MSPSGWIMGVEVVVVGPVVVVVVTTEPIIKLPTLTNDTIVWNTTAPIGRYQYLLLRLPESLKFVFLNDIDFLFVSIIIFQTNQPASHNYLPYYYRDIYHQHPA